MRRLTKPRNQNGFSLIELLVVIIIIGILATAVAMYSTGAIHKARIEKAKADVVEAGRIANLAVTQGVLPEGKTSVAAHETFLGTVGDASTALPHLALDRPVDLYVTGTDFCLVSTEPIYDKYVGYRSGQGGVIEDTASAVCQAVSSGGSSGGGGGPVTPPAALVASYLTPAFTQTTRTVTPTVSGAAGALTFSTADPLPAGVTLDPTTGALTQTGFTPWGKHLTSVARGTGDFTIALGTDGTVYGFGANDYGQLGDGTTNYSNTPVTVATAGTALQGKTVTQVAAGSTFALALASDGKVYGWGRSEFGQLGTGTLNFDPSAPTAVTTAGTPMAGKTITQIAAGPFSSYALASDGTVYGWGDNWSGSLGIGAPTSAHLPTAMVTAGTPMAGKTIVEIAASDYNLYLLASDGTVYATGTNSWGTVGDGTNTDRRTPVAVKTSGTPMAGKTIKHIYATSGSAVAVDNAGAAYTWGYNYSGQLGDGTTTSRNAPVSVLTAGTPLAGKAISEVAAGRNFVVALTTDGTLAGWGSDSYNALNDGGGIVETKPIAVPRAAFALNGSTPTHVTTSGSAVFVVTSDGNTYVWGANYNGQAGTGGTYNNWSGEGSDDARLSVAVPVGVGSTPATDFTATITVTDGSRTVSTGPVNFTWDGSYSFGG